MSSSQAIAPAARRRGAKAYLLSSAWAQVCALLRYVLLARLLGPEQLGLAATLILTASFFDLISDIGGDRFLIQDPEGGEARVQGLVQLVLVVRGFLISAAMAAFAWPVALFYKAPALGPGLAILGLAPLITGFLHLDLRRTQRDNDFRGESTCALACEAAGLVATVVAALVTRNFTAVLYGLITRAFVWVLCSHLIAKRRYSIAYSGQDAGRLARFSAPLMLNGLILFLGGQGDRVLVSRRIGFAALGHYSAVILLIFYPSAVIQKYAHALYLPMIAAERSDPVRRGKAAGDLASQTLLLSVGMSAGFALVAPFMVSILYGRAFAMAAWTVALIGILQASRFLSVWPTTVALAMGRSTIVLANNVVRLIAWPAALTWVLFDPSLSGVVAGFLLGELLAFVVALVMLNRSEEQRLFHGFERFAVFIASSALILGWIWVVEHPSMPLIAALALASVALAGRLVQSEIATIRGAIVVGRRLVLRR